MCQEQPACRSPIGPIFCFSGSASAFCSILEAVQLLPSLPASPGKAILDETKGFGTSLTRPWVGSLSPHPGTITHCTFSKRLFSQVFCRNTHSAEISSSLKALDLISLLPPASSFPPSADIRGSGNTPIYVLVPTKSLSFGTDNTVRSSAAVLLSPAPMENSSRLMGHCHLLCPTTRCLYLFVLTLTITLSGFFFFFFFFNPFTLGIIFFLKTFELHLASYLMAIPGIFQICCLLHTFKALPTL